MRRRFTAVIATSTFVAGAFESAPAHAQRQGPVSVGSVAPLFAPRPTALSQHDLESDIDALQMEMETRWAYLRTNGADYRTPLAALRARAAGGMTRADYALEVLKIISLFVDGHANVSGVEFPPGQLPFIIEYTNEHFVAVRGDRAAFVDSEYPYITRIDHHPVDDWIQAASQFVTKGSPQWVRRNALRHVARVQFMRGVMGLSRTDSVTIEVESRDGTRTRRITLPVSPRVPELPRRPLSGSRVINDSVGYLRIESMDAAAVSEVAAWMPKFRDTRGLIIDVRGNTGGSRDALRALFPYFMSDVDAPRVVNAAKYRFHPDYSDDHLGGSRYMYRETWIGWGPAERTAITQFKATFRPQWNPPNGEFSDWHYFVLSRAMNPDAYVYARPAIVLLDQDSFSATDIFVAAFKGWRNVTLMGTPSAGGSARQVGVSLPVSRLSLSLASMASFQANGRLFDGNGTSPDILVQPEPEFFLIGGRDVVLEKALERLK